MQKNSHATVAFQTLGPFRSAVNSLFWNILHETPFHSIFCSQSRRSTSAKYNKTDILVGAYKKTFGGTYRSMWSTSKITSRPIDWFGADLGFRIVEFDLLRRSVSTL